MSAPVKLILLPSDFAFFYICCIMLHFIALHCYGFWEKQWNKYITKIINTPQTITRIFVQQLEILKSYPCTNNRLFITIFRCRRQGFLRKWTIIFGVPLWKKVWETLTYTNQCLYNTMLLHSKHSLNTQPSTSVYSLTSLLTVLHYCCYSVPTVLPLLSSKFLSFLFCSPTDSN
jgi:hypothetical protein